MTWMFSVEAKGLEPSNLLTASQALYQLSYAPEDASTLSELRPRQPLGGPPGAPSLWAPRLSPLTSRLWRQPFLSARRDPSCTTTPRVPHRQTNLFPWRNTTFAR